MDRISVGGHSPGFSFSAVLFFSSNVPDSVVFVKRGVPEIDPLGWVNLFHKTVFQIVS
jgi:hypothetical protein